MLQEENPQPSIDLIEGWEKVPIKECGEGLVRLNGLVDSAKIIFDVDFFNQFRKPEDQKPQPRVFLRKGASERLLRSAEILQEKYGREYKFLIYSGFRNIKDQQEEYEKIYQKKTQEFPGLTTDELEKIVGEFVIKPAGAQNPPPHTTGGALDLTIIIGKERLTMRPQQTSPHEDVSKTDYYNNATFEPELSFKRNREILLQVMKEAGFTNYPKEYWHFDYGNQFWGKIKGVAAIYGIAQP